MHGEHQSILQPWCRSSCFAQLPFPPSQHPGVGRGGDRGTCGSFREAPGSGRSCPRHFRASCSPQSGAEPPSLPLPLQGTVPGGRGGSIAPSNEAGVSLSLLLSLLTQVSAEGTLGCPHCCWSKETAQSSLLAVQGAPERNEQTKTPLYHSNAISDFTVLPNKDEGEIHGELRVRGGSLSWLGGQEGKRNEEPGGCTLIPPKKPAQSTLILPGCSEGGA